MADIKTRDTSKGTIKTINKAAVATERMKKAYVMTKDKAEHSTNASENSAEEYASDKIEAATDRTVHETAYRADKVGRWGMCVKQDRIIRKPKRELRISRPSVQRNSFRNNRSILSENRASELWSVRRKQLNSLQGRQEIRQSRPYRKVQPILFRGRLRPQNKRQRLLLRPQEAAIIAQKTAKTTAKATQKAAQTAKKAAKATADTVKATAKATVATVKAILAGTKALVAAIAAGGWIAVLIIMIVVLFGAAVAMFGGGSDSNSYTPVSAEVEAYEPIIQKYAKEYGIPEYVELIKAVMMQESGGRGLDPMQAAEGSFNTSIRTNLMELKTLNILSNVVFRN